MAAAQKLVATALNVAKQSTQVVGKVTPGINTFLKYAKTELYPPTLADLPAIKKGYTDIFNSLATGKFADLTVRQAALNSLVAIEVGCWFYVGEIIGRGSIIGYAV